MYRTEEEVQRWQDQKDPVSLFADFLTKQNVLTAKLDQQIKDGVAARLRDAVAFAENSPFPEPHEALEDLFVSY
jgi:pyruvate dehydrogenase E1 component alpha subunit